MVADLKWYHFGGCLPMKSNMNKLIYAVVMWMATLVVGVVAQQAEVSVKVDLVAWGDDLSGLSLKSAADKGEITALAFRYSKPVAYHGPEVMEIFRHGDGEVKVKPAPTADDTLQEMHPLVVEAVPATANAAAKDVMAMELEKRRKKEPSLVALACIPPHCQRVTVLLAPAAGGTLVAYVIDDDPSKLPLGQLRIHNLSQHTIAMRCNNQAPKALKTRESMVVEAPKQQVLFELSYLLGDDWKFQESNIIPVRANEQTQMIILRSSNRFFRSSDGSSGGFMQVVTLRRTVNPAMP